MGTIDSKDMSPSLIQEYLQCVTEEEESSWHIIGDCQMLRNKRWQPFLDDPPDWRPWKLLQFLHDSKIIEMNKREIPNLSQSQ